MRDRPKPKDGKIQAVVAVLTGFDRRFDDPEDIAREIMAIVSPDRRKRRRPSPPSEPSFYRGE